MKTIRKMILAFSLAATSLTFGAQPNINDCEQIAKKINKLMGINLPSFKKINDKDQKKIFLKDKIFVNFQNRTPNDQWLITKRNLDFESKKLINAENSQSGGIFFLKIEKADEGNNSQLKFEGNATLVTMIDKVKNVEDRKEMTFVIDSPNCKISKCTNQVGDFCTLIR